MTTGTKQGFFASLTEDELENQGVSTDILPVKKGDGAPPKAEYLLEVDEDNTTAEIGRNNGTRFTHMQISVVEPPQFAGRKIFINLFPFKTNGDPQKWVAANIAAIGGLDMVRHMPDDPEECCDFLAEHLPGKQFVGRLGVESSDDYDDKNTITNYFPRSRWSTGSTESKF